MIRPCFLVVDPEHSGSISTRKLVIESAKLNVITAYSGEEALETIKKFPAIDGLICNSEVRDIPAAKLVQTVKKLHPKLPVIVVGPLSARMEHADFHVESFDPKRLLNVLQAIEPDRVEAIIEQEDKLRDKEEE